MALLVFIENLQMYSTSCPSFKLPEGQVYLQPNTPSLKESPFLELVELAPAIACSFVATSYIIHAESTRDDISSMNVEVRLHVSPFSFSS